MKAGLLVLEDGHQIAAWLADSWFSRLRGLLGRKPLARDGSQALVITPCASVHTCWMTYPLDLVYLDRDSRVCGWREEIMPWRLSACRGAAKTVELYGGSLKSRPLTIGEVWRWHQLKEASE